MAKYNKTLFCICGETASGKDTLTTRLINEYPDQFKAVCSHASRPMRDGEVDGREHYFITKEEFKKLKEENEGHVIAYTHIASKDGEGYEYMALESELETSNIYVIDYNGIKFLKEHFQDKIENIVVIYITAPLQDRIQRASIRSDFKSAFKKRVMNEFEQFLDLNLSGEYDYIIPNLNNSGDMPYEVLTLIVSNYVELKKRV